jgi:hypothetical protein
MRRRGRRREQPLDDLKETTGYWKLKEETLGYTLWRTSFGRGYGPVARQKVMNEYSPYRKKYPEESGTVFA